MLRHRLAVPRLTRKDGQNLKQIEFDAGPETLVEDTSLCNKSKLFKAISSSCFGLETQHREIDFASQATKGSAEVNHSDSCQSDLSTKIQRHKPKLRYNAECFILLVHSSRI